MNNHFFKVVSISTIAALVLLTANQNTATDTPQKKDSKPHYLKYLQANSLPSQEPKNYITQKTDPVNIHHLLKIVDPRLPFIFVRDSKTTSFDQKIQIQYGGLLHYVKPKITTHKNVILVPGKLLENIIARIPKLSNDQIAALDPLPWNPPNNITPEAKVIPTPYLDSSTPNNSETTTAQTDSTPYESDFYLNPNLARVILEPLRKAKIASQVNTPVIEVKKLPGESFDPGDVLIQLDDRVTKANLNKAVAMVEQAELDVEMRTQLLQDDIGSLTELLEAQTRLATAKADLAAAARQQEATQVIAPYSGRVNEVYVHDYELAEVFEPLIDIIGTEAYTARMLVEATQLSNLAIGQSIQIHFTDPQMTVDATVSRIGAEIDPASSTIRVDAEIKSPDARLTPGMTGVAIIPSKQNAHNTDPVPDLKQPNKGLQSPNPHGSVIKFGAITQEATDNA